MDPAIDIKGLVQVSISKSLTRDGAKGIGIVGINAVGDQDPVAWVVSADQLDKMEGEKRNLIKAKVRAIIGTAVFGAGLAIALGVIIGLTNKKK